MALSIKKFREIVFQLLYNLNFEKSDEEIITSLVMRTQTVPKTVVREAKEKATAIWEKCSELDEKIRECAKEFDFEKISRVELSLLRLAVYELLHTEIPGKVVIAEAVRLTRKFGTKESASFVNALLDGVYHAKEPATV